MNNKNAVALLATLIVSMVFVAGPMLSSVSAVDSPSPSWRTKTAMPTARGQAAVVTGDDGLIYVMGGFAGGLLFTTVEAYNPLTNAWTAKAPMPVAVRGASFAKGLDGIIYVIGGAGASNAVQAYNVTSNSWSTKANALNGTWMASAATSNDGKIVMIGGESSGAFYNNATQIYDPAADSWTLGADMPTGRSELGVVKGADGLIYAMGGINGSAMSTVEAYNPSTNTWTRKASMPTPKVEFGVTLGPDGKIYVIGGGTSYGNNNGPFFNSVEVYDPRTNTWSIPGWSESSMPTARKEFSAVTGLNGMIYAIGGANGAYIATNEEAFVVLPENVSPTSYIDSVTPNPVTRGQTVSFVGHGADADGSVVAYKWRSSLNGTLSTASSFGVSTLAVGTHTIYFSVKDDDGAWSSEAVAAVTVNVPIEEDPTYQRLVDVNQTLSDKADDLAQQNVDLQTRISDLEQQNADLSDAVDALAARLDTTTWMLLGTGVVTIVLVVVAIALVYMGRRKPAA